MFVTIMTNVDQPRW